MKNEKSENKTHSLKVEKTIATKPENVFRAIGEGRLFLNCSANAEELKVDFRVGGEYFLHFLGHGKNRGEFLEIIPNQKIVFSWCQAFGTDPDTIVTVDLKPEGDKTHLTITHTGFRDEETMKAHEGGWTGGVNDLVHEMLDGRLRFNRRFAVPVPKLFEKCKNMETFLGLIGDAEKAENDFKVGGKFRLPVEKGETYGNYLEIVPNEKIVFSFFSPAYGLKHESRVTLKFESDDDDANVSWLELVHEGLNTEELQKSHHEGWDWILAKMMSAA